MKRKQRKKPQQTKKKKKTEDIHQKTHAPWWSDRIRELSQMMPIQSYKYNENKISWLSKRQHTPTIDHTYILEELDCKCLDQKEIKHQTKRSKKVIPDDELLVSRKIRIKPTTQQKQQFQRWFGVHRFAYNEALRLVTERSWKPNWKGLTMYILNREKNEDAKHYPWFFDHKVYPYDLKKSSIHEFCSAIASTEESLKAKDKNPNHFLMEKKKKNGKTQCFHID